MTSRSIAGVSIRSGGLAGIVVGAQLLAGCSSGDQAGSTTERSLASVEQAVHAAAAQRVKEKPSPVPTAKVEKRFATIRACLTEAGFSSVRVLTLQGIDAGTKVDQFDVGNAIVFLVVGPTHSATKDWTASEAEGGTGFDFKGRVYGDAGVAIGLPAGRSFSSPSVVTLRRDIVSCVR